MDRKRVEHILRACVAEREREGGRLPGQTEELCRALLLAWDTTTMPDGTVPGSNLKAAVAWMRQALEMQRQREQVAAERERCARNLHELMEYAIWLSYQSGMKPEHRDPDFDRRVIEWLSEKGLED